MAETREVKIVLLCIVVSVAACGETALPQEAYIKRELKMNNYL